MKRLALVFVVALGIASTPALTGTHDGQTPAEESICDGLEWATPGLYGLCLGFCEAQDCEPDFSLDNPLENCKPASRKILENYRKKMRPGDPDMPCVQAPCPCWTPEELDGLRQRTPWNSHERVYFKLDMTIPGVVTNYDEWAIQDPFYYPYYRTVVSTQEWHVDYDAPICFLLDTCLFCSLGDSLNVTRHLVISSDEHAVCEAQVVQSAYDRGLLPGD
jgi:hypothetical protein